ncbi:MAG: coiled-coil domain-containing protein [Rhodothalassiaceae bacterium]
MTIQFDTLAFSKSLEDVGLPRDQAERIATGARDMITADVATKADIAGAEARLEQKITDLKGELRDTEKRLSQETGGVKSDLLEAEGRLLQEIAAIRAEIATLKAELASVRAELATLKAELATLEVRFEKSLSELRSEFHEGLAQMETRLMRMLLAGFGGTVALIKLFDYLG